MGPLGAMLHLWVMLVLLGPWALPVVEATTAQATSQGGKNPVRKVVNMLTKMAEKVTAEGKKEEKLHEKFMCYCKTNGATLAESIQAGKDKIEELQSATKSGTEKKKNLEADLADHKQSRLDAKEAVNKATALREKQAAQFTVQKADADTNIAAVTKAIDAIDKGMGKSLLQTGAANTVRKYILYKSEMPDENRQEVLAFLSGKQRAYSPAGGEISGILQTIKDEMVKNLADSTASEKDSQMQYDQLVAAKEKEVNALQAQIEEELLRVGELGKKLASMEADLETTQEALEEDLKFLAGLEKECKTKASEWEVVQKERQEELLAISQTIKILNDDDALELFKKTLPGDAAAASFLQMQASTHRHRKRHALKTLHSAKKRHTKARHNVDLIELALAGKQAGFEKVVRMVDTMVATLEREQKDDDDKKEYCESELDAAEDKEKELKIAISDSKTALDDIEGTIETMAEEISKLEDGIVKLDKAVAEATAMRKMENQEHKDQISSETAAKEVLMFAKSRLNKFYNPNMPSLAQVDEYGSYAKQREQSAGVIANINVLISELDKSMTEAAVIEKNAQEEYEKIMSDAAAKRAEDAKLATEKSSAKASEEEAKAAEKKKLDDTQLDVMGVAKKMHGLHGECDFLLKFYGARKEARADETDALKKARAVLSGADYSFLQIGLKTTARYTAKAHGFLAPN